MSVKLNLVIPKGTTFITTISISDANGAFDTTGCTAYASFRKHYGSNTAISFGTSLTYGQIRLTLDPENTASLSDGKYVYDVIMVDGSNTITRIIEGMIDLTPSVTSFPA